MSNSKKIRNALRREYKQSCDRLINQVEAHLKGKRTVFTISNPEKDETNKPFIRVTGKELFPREDRKHGA